MNTQLARTEPQAPPLSLVKTSPNSIAKLDMQELRELAEIMVASGAFNDIKQLAQAQVKILAGQEFGFSPIVSMTGIHFFQGKVEFSATLKAAVIRSSGKYDYEITEHSATACEAQFYRIDSGQRIKLGVPVRYTMDDAKAAGLSGKGPWKDHPMDMLFAAVIRQGMRRHCAELLHGTAADVDAVELDEHAEAEKLAATGEIETATTAEGDVVDTATGEVIEEAGETPAVQSAEFLETSVLDRVRDLVRVKFSGEDGKVDQDELRAFLGTRNPATMPDAELEKLADELAAL